MHLDYVFPEAVELFLEGPDPQIQDISLHEIEKSAHIENHPKAFADLMAYVLTHEDQPFWKGEDMITVIRNLMDHKALKPQLLEMCNQLLRLGCMEAAELAEEVEKLGDS